MKKFLFILLALALVITPSAAYGTTWLNVKNNAVSTLSAAMTASQTSFAVVTGDGALFPASSFTVMIDDEIIYVSTRSSDNFTIGSRAYESTTAATHAAGATVSLNVTAQIITQIQSAVDNITDNTSINSAISLKHTQGTDTALGTVGTKNPPIDADLAIYRDSTAGNALVTSTWTQVKSFLKTYFDGIYGVGSGNVTVTGSPTTGQWAKFTSGTNITASTTTPVTTDNGTLNLVMAFYNALSYTASQINTAIANVAGISRSGTTTTITDNLSTKHIADNATDVFVNGKIIAPSNYYCAGYMNDVTNFRSGLTTAQDIRVPKFTVDYDPAGMITCSDWKGATGARVQADGSGCSSTHIIDADGGFTEDMRYLVVYHSSDAGGTANAGISVITTVASGDLTITKMSGADFANSYYYYFAHNEITIPTTGLYLFVTQMNYDAGEADKNFYIRVPKYTGGTWTYTGGISEGGSSGAATCNVRSTKLLSCTAGDKFSLAARHAGTGGTPGLYGSQANCYIQVLLVKQN